MFGPAGTSPDIIARLNREIGAALQTDEVKKAFIQQGVETEHSTPEGLGEILRQDIASYRELATKAGIARH
jgi:tripartite-type tricarboxylate transporter receptor subunit TctC